MTLNGGNALFQKQRVLRSPPEKNLNEGRPILSAAKSRPVILVSRNNSLSYMRIFAAVPRRRGVHYNSVLSKTAIFIVFTNCNLSDNFIQQV